MRNSNIIRTLVRDTRGAEIAEAAAVLPVMFMILPDGRHEVPDGRPFPTALESFKCNRYELAKFARDAQELNVRYIGICCGNEPAHTRAVAEALGRRPEASRYSPDMSRHFAFGTDPSLDRETLSVADRL